MAIQIAQDPHADRVLEESPFALLTGMLLDQQFPMERAFAGPANILDASAPSTPPRSPRPIPTSSPRCAPVRRPCTATRGRWRAASRRWPGSSPTSTTATRSGSGSRPPTGRSCRRDFRRCPGSGSRSRRSSSPCWASSSASRRRAGRRAAGRLRRPGRDPLGGGRGGPDLPGEGPLVQEGARRPQPAPARGVNLATIAWARHAGRRVCGALMRGSGLEARADVSQCKRGS